MTLAETLSKILPSGLVQKLYFSTGEDVGNEISLMLQAGEWSGFERLLDSLVFLESLYAAKGFRPIPMQRFVDFGGYRKPLADVAGQLLEAGEQPVFYARHYKENGFDFEYGRDQAGPSHP